jgi:hypothetical protein
LIFPEKGNTLQYYSKGSGGCVKAGKDFAEGDVYSANHLRYKCQNGMMDVTGCYADEGTDMQIGQDVVEKNMVRRCYRLGPKVKMAILGKKMPKKLSIFLQILPIPHVSTPAD